MSKMGISCLSSYQGAQIFEAIGIGKEAIDRWFPGTASRIGGIGLAEIAHESLLRHASGFEPAAARAEPRRVDEDALDVGGVYFWRVGGERHLWSPTHGREPAEGRAPRGRAVVRRVLAGASTTRATRPSRCAAAGTSCRQATPVPLDEVEPAAQIVRRFATGAMSFGSISQGGAREPRHRDEPHRRQVEQRRGRRGRGALRAAAERRLASAAPSSRWRARASA